MKTPQIIIEFHKSSFEQYDPSSVDIRTENFESQSDLEYALRLTIKQLFCANELKTSDLFKKQNENNQNF